MSPILALSISTQIEHKTKSKKSTREHFDLDEDGRLSTYESALYKTHLKFGYPLVEKKDQIPYDFNQNWMLEPAEMQQYQRFKATGQSR